MPIISVLYHSPRPMIIIIVIIIAAAAAPGDNNNSNCAHRESVKSDHLENIEMGIGFADVIVG